MSVEARLVNITKGLKEMTDTLEKQKNSTGRSCFLSFFTVMLILTLDASNGKDLLDVIVPYIESLSQ
jgi:hypothetical protein